MFYKLLIIAINIKRFFKGNRATRDHHEPPGQTHLLFPCSTTSNRLNVSIIFEDFSTLTSISPTFFAIIVCSIYNFKLGRPTTLCFYCFVFHVITRSTKQKNYTVRRSHSKKVASQKKLTMFIFIHRCPSPPTVSSVLLVNFRTFGAIMFIVY